MNQRTHITVHAYEGPEPRAIVQRVEDIMKVTPIERDPQYAVPVELKYPPEYQSQLYVGADWSRVAITETVEEVQALIDGDIQ